MSLIAWGPGAWSPTAWARYAWEETVEVPVSAPAAGGGGADGASERELEEEAWFESRLKATEAFGRRLRGEQPAPQAKALTAVGREEKPKLLLSVIPHEQIVLASSKALPSMLYKPQLLEELDEELVLAALVALID